MEPKVIMQGLGKGTSYLIQFFADMHCDGDIKKSVNKLLHRGITENLKSFLESVETANVPQMKKNEVAKHLYAAYGDMLKELDIKICTDCGDCDNSGKEKVCHGKEATC